MSMAVGAGGNLLLGTLPAEVLERAGVQEQDHAIRDVLITDEETPSFVFFPQAGAVASIVRITANGQMVEAGVVGNEGVLNLHSVLNLPSPTRSDAIVQNEGRFSRIAIPALRQLFDDHPRFREAVLAYTSVFLDMVTQNLVCNRLHPIEQRLAKWLLVMRDRVFTDQLLHAGGAPSGRLHRRQRTGVRWADPPSPQLDRAARSRRGRGARLRVLHPSAREAARLHGRSFLRLAATVPSKRYLFDIVRSKRTISDDAYI